MSNYRRADFPGGFYFFTVVTHNRRKIFSEPIARQCLHHSLEKIQLCRPFEIIAICLLPDHLHCVWELPENDADFSTRWSSIKAVFTREYLRLGGTYGTKTQSKNKHREAALWQRRFWEHLIRDENDLDKHIKYIHYNPVKHGLVPDVEDWPWSTYHRYKQQGVCNLDNIAGDNNQFDEKENFGE
jgi:putative transposase